MSTIDKLRRYKKAWKLALRLEGAKEELLVAHRLGDTKIANRAIDAIDALGVRSLKEVAEHCGLEEEKDATK